MRLTTCMASLGLSLLAGVTSHAAIVSKTNAMFGSFDGTYGYRDVVFDVADFAGDPTIVLDVGESAAGTWRLFVEDDTGPLFPDDPASPLEFTSFTRTITTAFASNTPIPEPSSVAVFSLVAVGMGLGVLHRRRKAAMN